MITFLHPVLSMKHISLNCLTMDSQFSNIFFTGCKNDFPIVTKNNSIQAYEDFIQNYPES